MIDLLLVDLPLKMDYVAPLNLAVLKSIAMQLGYNIKCVDFSHEYNERYSEALYKYKVDEISLKASVFRTMSKVVFFTDALRESKEFDELAFEIANKINEYDAKVIGFTTRADSLYLAFKIAQYVNAKVILGGPGVLFSYRFFEKYPKINAIFVGDAEETLPIWLPKIMRSNVANGPILPLRPFKFDKLIIPDYSDFNLDKYKTIGIETQRGCINSCRYCSLRQYPYPGLRLKPIEFIDKEVEVLKQHGKDFFLCDNITNVSKERMIEICKVFYKHGCRFHAVLAPDIDEEVAEWLSKCAFQITVGVESLSNSTIRLMGRRYTWEKVKESLQALKKYNVQVHCMFIFGFPKSKLASELLTAIRLLKYSDLFTTVALGNFILTYNSYVYKHPEEFGIRIIRDGELEAVLNCVPFEMSKLEALKIKVVKFIVNILNNYFDQMGKVYYWKP